MPCSVFDAAATEPSSQPESMEVDPPDYASQAPSTPISTEALRTVSDEREAEHQQRQKNGNIIPCNKKKTGAPIDELCASLAIERVGPKGNGKGDATYYYCIGCDERRANNSWLGALPHAKKCKVCTLLSCC